jgi:hypothetical protein
VVASPEVPGIFYRSRSDSFQGGNSFGDTNKTHRIVAKFDDILLVLDGPLQTAIRKQRAITVCIIGLPGVFRYCLMIAMTMEDQKWVSDLKKRKRKGGKISSMAPKV